MENGRIWRPSCPEAGYPARAPALSRARRRDGAPDLVLTLPRQGSRPGPVSGEGTRTAAEHLRAAMTQAAVALGDEEIAQGLTAAQVLEDTAATNSATRWRSGPESRRLTAVLARLRQGLSSVLPGLDSLGNS